MEIKRWKEDKENEGSFYKIKKINNTYYKLSFTAHFYKKSIKVDIGVTSGIKRKHLDDYTVNDNYRDGGIKALFWLKKEVDKIYDFLDSYYFLDNKKKRYLCIRWEDSQRRNVYSRLIKEGFYFMNEEGTKALIKRVK